MKIKSMKMPWRMTYTSLFMYGIVVTFLVRHLTDISFFGTTALYFMMGIAAFAYAYLVFSEYRQLMRLLLFVDIIAGFDLLANGNHNAFNAVVLLTAQVLGILVYHNRKNLKLLDIVGILIILYLTYKVTTTPKVLISSWQYGIILSKLVWQNAVSIIIIEFLSFDLIYRLECKKKVNYLIFAIALIVAIICDGIGGILSISLFCIGVWIVNQKRNTLYWWKILLLATVVIIFLKTTDSWEKVIETLTDDNSRIYIWSCYIECVDSIKAFLLGAAIDRNIYLMKMANMHNTVLNWHYNFGLIPLAFFLWMLIVDFKYCIKTKNYTLLLIMCITCLRAMTDEASYSFMPIWTYVWIEANMRSRSRRIECEKND